VTRSSFGLVIRAVSTTITTRCVTVLLLSMDNPLLRHEHITYHHIDNCSLVCCLETKFSRCLGHTVLWRCYTSRRIHVENQK
jgi:hypothetical protein